MYNVKISSTGMILPQTVWSNDDVIKKINDSKQKLGMPTKEIIAQQFESTTQIRERRHFDSNLGEDILTVSVNAARKAIEKAKWSPEDVDFIIFSSISNSEDESQKIPTLACKIQYKLNAWNCSIAYDMQAACSGWLFGMANGISLIQSKIAKKGIIICSEKHQRWLDYTNEKSCMLIGDAATATCIEWSDVPKILNLKCKTNEKNINPNIIRLDYDVIDDNYNSKRGYFSLDGKDVYKLGIESFVKLTKENIETSKINPDWFIYHQANGAMLERVSDLCQVPKEKNLMTIQTLGNTTAATIPSVLDTYLENGTIKEGDKISFVAFGGGITMGYIMAEI